MRLELNILRRKNADSDSYYQLIPFEFQDERITVAKALIMINEQKPEDPIVFEHSCHQKKCGACAMVINGRPCLASDVYLKDFAKKGRVTIEPLKKFPLVADLMVDRTILMENLKKMSAWIPDTVKIKEKNADAVYEASRCLQCGCCLEVCPNFYAGGDYFGPAASMPAARLLSSMTKEQNSIIREEYKKHIYNGCGKSLACRDVCPAGIDMDHLLSRSNAVAVWRRNV